METSVIIKQLAACMHVREDAMWGIYYETGIEYLEQLKQRIKYKSYFELQFGNLLRTGLLLICPTDAFNRIENSPLFWNWWSVILVRIYNLYKTKSTQELSIRSLFISDLIPSDILIKIFDKNERIKKEPGNRKGAYIKPSKERCCTE